MVPHLRIARPVRNLSRSAEMYCEGLGIQVLAEFENHEGFDGKMVGFPGAEYHFEFTSCPGHPVTPSPTDEDLAVFYFPDYLTWEERCRMMLQAGFEKVNSFNPYWDVRGQTFTDEDGYRTAIQNASWK